MGVTVCSERSSCPCLCSGVVRLAHRKCEVMAQYHVQTAYEGFKVLPPKKKNAAPQQAKNFVGVKRRQNDRVCCRAVRSFRAIAHRKVVVITVSTTTFQCDL